MLAGIGDSKPFPGLGDLAYSNASVLSIPYALNELLPKINDSLS
jgi:hypothetical protein